MNLRYDWKLRHWRSVIFLVSAVVLAYVYLLHYSNTMPINSDYANDMLIAQDMLQGNIFLHGWLLSPDPYWVTNLVVYAPILKVLGFSSFASHVASTLVYLLLCISAVAAVACGPRKDGRSVRLGIVLLPMLALSPSLANLTLVGPQHVGTLAAVLLVILLWHQERASLFDSKSMVTLFLLYVFNVSDPFVMWVYTVPLLTMTGFAIFSRRFQERKRLWLPLLIALLADVLSLFTKLMAMHFGYLRTYSLTISWTKDLSENVNLLLHGFPAMYGVALSGRPIDLIAGALHLLVFIPAVLYLGIVPIRWLRSTQEDLTSALLSISAVSLIAEFVLSSVPLSLASLRYLLPTFVFSLIVLAREIDLVRVREYFRRWLTVQKQQMVLASVGLLLLFPGVGSIVTPAAATQWPRIAAWLKQHHLQSGYGPYWDASILTLYSGGKVSVRAITGAFDQRHRVVLIPYLWIVMRNWYQRSPDTRFVIYDPADYGDVQRSTIVRTFGPPAQKHDIGKYVIFIWDHPIYASCRRFRCERQTARGSLGVFETKGQTDSEPAVESGRLFRAGGLTEGE